MVSSKSDVVSSKSDMVSLKVAWVMSDIGTLLFFVSLSKLIGSFKGTVHQILGRFQKA